MHLRTSAQTDPRRRGSAGSAYQPLLPVVRSTCPADSLVALLIASGRILLTARYDLVEPLEPAVQELVEQHRPSGLVLVAYCSDVERGRAALRAQADRVSGVDLIDLLVVDGHRWWSMRCTSGCCPPEGTPYAPDEHPLSSEAVWAGLVARPDRAAVVRTVAGPPEAEWEALRERAGNLSAHLEGDSRSERQDALGQAVVDALPRVDPAVVDRAGRRLDDAACLELALLVRETLVRDVACALVTTQDARRHLALWQEVVGRTPPEMAAGPLCLAGVAAWAGGNGTVLNACCERLAALDPAYPMGRLLSDVSVRGLPPVWWDAMADGLRRDLGLRT